MQRNRRSRAALGLVMTFAALQAAVAHPVHATFAEAVWNPKTRSIEVAFRVRGLDLEDALSKGRDKKVDLDKTDGVDSLIGTYLNKNFHLKLPDGSTLSPKWSDKDVGITNCWLYFEFPLPAKIAPAQCTIRNSTFFDDLDGQKNVIEYRHGKSKRILSFEGKTREHLLELPTAAAD